MELICFCVLLLADIFNPDRFSLSSVSHFLYIPNDELTGRKVSYSATVSVFLSSFSVEKLQWQTKPIIGPTGSFITFQRHVLLIWPINASLGRGRNEIINIKLRLIYPGWKLSSRTMRLNILSFLIKQ